MWAQKVNYKDNRNPDLHNIPHKKGVTLDMALGSSHISVNA